ncbi:MAG: O-antigen ligase family protein [Chthoniobacterales bacterium]
MPTSAIRSSQSAVRNATRLLFLAALFYAPWAYGCTTAESIVGLDWLLGAVVVLWLADLLISRRRPVAPTTAIALVGLLLALGWGMALNGRAVYDPVFAVFTPVARHFAALPGSYDAVNSVALMIRCTVLLLSLLFVADLVQRPQWLLRLWHAIGAAGGSIALLGLIQKGSGARMIFWGDWLESGEGPSFFATYFYHANAGAYLNLVFPATVALAARAFGTRASPTLRAFWATAALAVTVAILANTSRAAQFFGILLMVAVFIMSRRQLGRAVRGADKGTLIVGAIVGMVALYAVAQASRLDKPLKRWTEISSTVPQDSRWASTLTALPAAREAGWFGFGPAAFRSVFPHYVEGPESKVEGTWRFLHEDYLQTIIEWGWIGSTLWALLFFGGMAVALRTSLRFRQTWLPRQRVLLPLLLLALATVALHAFVDFPLQIASVQFYVATYLGVCWGCCCWDKAK